MVDYRPQNSEKRLLFRNIRQGNGSGIVDDSKPQHLMVRMNQSSNQTTLDKKAPKEIKVKVSESTETVQEFISEDIVKKHMSNSKGKQYPSAKLYDKNGLELADDDILYLKTGDVVYLARHGEPFNYQQILDRYEKLEKLGSGGFGKVYLCQDKEQNNRLCAIKVISMNEYFQKADGIYEIDREAKTMRMLNSKYIIQLENYFIHSQKEVILVMEYAQGGELKQYIDKKPGKKISEYECQQLMKQIVHGLSSCHSKGIIHRDLKLENILFYDKEQTHIKIADFGIAGFCLKHLKEKTDAGTFKYMAPEVLKGDINLANPQMDIWALGVMMFLMLFGFHPFINKKEREAKQYDIKVVVQRIINDPVDIPYPTIGSSDSLNDRADSNILQDSEVPILTEDCRLLLHSLMNKNPKERIPLIEVKEHPWFEKTEEEIIAEQQEIMSKMLEAEALKQEKAKQKLQIQMQKRHTLMIPGSSGYNPFSNNRNIMVKSPIGAQSTLGSSVGRKMATLQPNNNPFKQNDKQQHLRKGLGKALSSLDADNLQLKKKSSLSPAIKPPQNNLNQQLYIKRQ